MAKLKVASLKVAAAYFAAENVLPMIYAFISERCSDLPVSTRSSDEGVDIGLLSAGRQPVTDLEFVAAYAAMYGIWTIHPTGIDRTFR